MPDGKNHTLSNPNFGFYTNLSYMGNTKTIVNMQNLRSNDTHWHWTTGLSMKKCECQYDSIPIYIFLPTPLPISLTPPHLIQHY